MAGHGKHASTSTKTSPARKLAAAVAALALGLFAPLVATAATPTEAATLSGITTSFEIDGNIAGANDWAGGGYGPGTTPAPGSYPTTGIVYMNEVVEACVGDGSGLTETTVSTISQSIHSYPWTIGTGDSVTPKSDLCSAAVALEIVDVDGQQHVMLYQNWSRSGDGTGDLSIFYSFLGGAAGADGDRLLEFNFSPSNGSIALYQWVWNGTSFTQAAGTLQFDAAIGVHPDWDTPEPSTFGEFAIDLTANGLLSDETCATFQTGDIVTRTGNSGPANSQLQDFIDVPSQSLVINNCNGLAVSKVVNGTAPDGLEFPYVIDQVDGEAVHGPAGATSATTTDTDASVASISSTIQAGETQTWTGVLSQPDYRVAELVDSLPAGVTGVSVVCTYQDWYAPGRPTVSTTVWENGAYTGSDFPILPSGIGAAAPSCVITNQVTSLTLDKIVVNDDGGTAAVTDFPLTATPTGGGAAVISGTDTDAAAGSTLAAVVAPGQYTIAETNLAGYAASDWVCTNGTYADGVVTVPEGAAVSCAITNDDLPAHLTLVKQVVNDDGGTADDGDFTLTATGPTSISGVEAATTVTNAEVSAGTYTIGETPLAGYSLTDISCWTDGSRLTEITVTDGQITLANDATAFCELTNDDQPGLLTLIKDVITLDGGTAVATDWTLSADGPTAGVTGAGGVGGDAGMAVDAGDYVLSETDGPSGYAPGAWVCDGAFDAATSTVTVPNGVHVTCRITNDDIAPRLTLIKQIVNDDGGQAEATDWILTADGPTPGVSGSTGSAAVQNVAVLAGTYDLSESGPAGYAPGAWACTGTGTQDDASIALAVGQSAVCTIINNDIPATLTLVKEIVNDDGGTSVVGDWTLTATGTEDVISGITTAAAITGAPVDAGVYELSEASTVTGYEADAWSCVGGSLVGSTLTLANAESAVCTIINRDIPPTLTLLKDVVNDNGGMQPDTAWTLTATGPSDAVTGVEGDTAITDRALLAGSYTLTETGPDGYAASAWVCEGGTQDGASISIAAGQDVTCTITNNDISPQLTLVKEVVNDDGGTAAATDWTLTAAGTTPLTGITGTSDVTDINVIAGSYVLSEAGGPAGYTAGTWSCTDGTLTGDSLALLPGDDATCTIINNDQAALLTLIKSVENDAGGGSDVSDWTLTATGPAPAVTAISGITGATSVTAAAVSAGDYTLTESGPTGYEPGVWACTGGTVTEQGVVTVPNGGDVTCTIINRDIAPTLTLIKQVTNDNGGTEQASAWQLTADGVDADLTGTTGVTGAVLAGSYLLSEAGPAGYAASEWSCDVGSLQGSTITIGLAEDVTCTIVNDDIAPLLTLVKQVENDNGGDAAATEWTLMAAGADDTITGAVGDDAVTDAPVTAGVYLLDESGGPSGYTAGDWACDGGSLDGASLTLGVGDDVTCTIINNDVAPILTLEKVVLNDDGGSALDTDWTLTATGGANAPADVTGVEGDATITARAVVAGEYTLSEADGPAGYTPMGWTCDVDGVLDGSTLTLGVGQVVTCEIVNDDIAPLLTLVKQVVNDDGGTAAASAWTLTADGTLMDATGITGAAAVTSAPVLSGTYELSESDIDGYLALGWSCVGTGELAGSTLTLSPGDTATCTIVNDDVTGHLTLVKEVVNDDGGSAVAADWLLAAVNGDVTVQGDGGASSDVPAGAYDLSESGGPAGYTAGAWSCDGGTLVGSTVTLANGESATCTIVNDDVAPLLTLVKQVVNDDGGDAAAAEWTLTAAGADDTITGAVGDVAVTDAAVMAGAYDLSEAGGPSGYTASDWVCEGGALDGASLTLGVGDDVTCTIVNDDVAPLLTLVKEVVNDDGGTAEATEWTLTATGDDTITGAVGDAAVTDAAVTAGAYDLSESGGPAGYAAGEWVCDAGTLDGASLTLGVGDDVTCTIVNDDVAPLLTLVKEVVNDDGGTAEATDWTLEAAGTTPLSGTSGSIAVTAAAVDAGSYALSETGGPAGYTAGDWSCVDGTLDGASLTLLPGDVAICTIVNDDQPGSLTLVKLVENDDGGMAVDTEWTLTAAGDDATISGLTGDATVTGASVPAGDYSLSEDGPGGYEASTWVCVGGDLVEDAMVHVGNGASVTCTIVNDDIAPTLTLVKQVVNDDGGTAEATDWTLSATGTTAAASGVTGDAAVTDAVLLADTYELAETGPAGYAAGDWVCEGGALDGANLTLGVGDDVTCTIVNDDVAPLLTLVKEVVNDDGGMAEATDWTLSATGDDTISGAVGDATVTGAAVMAGAYDLSESDGPAGYAAGDWVCEGGTVDGANLTLGVGDDVTCTIVNDDVAPLLTLVKEVVNDDGGTAVATDWTLSATGEGTLSGAVGDAAVTAAAVMAGDYTLAEADGPTGYAAGDWVCEGGALEGAMLTLSVGDDVTCTIVNDDVAPLLTLVKEVTNDDGGTAVATDWTLSATGTDDTISGAVGTEGVTGAAVMAGDYTLAEADGPTGYAAGDWVCEGGALEGAMLTLSVGDDVTCTIVNDDVAPLLTLVKEVVNDDGGEAAAADWTLSAVAGELVVAGATGEESITAAAIPAGEYTLAEADGPAGYTAGAWVCDGGALEGAALTLGVGDDVTCTIVNDDQPVDLALDKDDGGAIAGLGTQFDYTITVTNVGERDVDGDEPVTVTDELPDGLTYVSGPEGCAAEGQTVTCSVDPVALTAGANVVLVLTVSVDEDAEPGVRVNLASVTTEDDLGPVDGTCESDSNNIDCVETPVVHGSLAGEKSVFEEVDGAWVASDGDVDYGDTVQYRIVVTAGGEAASTGVVVTDELQDGLMPDGLATCSITCTATLDGLAHRIEIASMAPGETVTITFTAIIPAAPTHAAGTTVTDAFDNEAAVSGDHSPETPTNTVTVSATDVTAAPPALPRTGGELPMSAIAVGLGLLTAGGLLLIRRRERDV